MRRPCRMAGGNRPEAELERWPRMAECPCSQGWREGTFMKEDLKPSLATTAAKVSRRVIVTLAL
jgi:hypothetical protein